MSRLDWDYSPPATLAPLVRDLPPVGIGTLRRGLDLRDPLYRRLVFQAFYQFHLAYRSHPGGVYALMPWLADRFGWDVEDRLWFAFLNGHTQNPVTSLALFRAAPSPFALAELADYSVFNWDRLEWDTDRRYQKKDLIPGAVAYARRVRRAGSQAAYWANLSAQGWPAVWHAARSLPSFGRLAAWSYLEYVRIMGGITVEPDTLMLDDLAGSRSHRNGLCIVLGLDQYDWHDSNPDFDGRYPRRLLALLAEEGAALLADARSLAAGRDWADDATYFTLESALCTYKSWHRPNRRYPNVYWDMHRDRLVKAEARLGSDATAPFWEARAALLPEHLRVECNPLDPGVDPHKQNHYRLTGEVVMMDVEYPWSGNAFNDALRAGKDPRA